MPIDARIPMGIRPIDTERFSKNRFRNEQIRGSQAQREKQQYEMGKERWAQERKMKAQQLMGGGGTSKERYDRLMQGGFSEEANAMRKADTEDQTGQLGNAEKSYKVIQQSSNAIGSHPTEENALAVLTGVSDNFGVNTDVYKQQVMQLGGDPAKIKEWAARMQLSAKEELFKSETTDTGGSKITRQIDPVTGAQMASTTDKVTLTPQQIASNAISKGQLGVSQANLGIARERLAMDQDKQNFEQVAAGQEAATKQKDEFAEQVELAAKEKETARVNIERADTAINTIDEIIADDDIDWNSTGTMGWALSAIGGSDASALESKLKTVQGILGFGELAKMRAASKTGGAVGQLSDRELSVLSSLVASLDIELQPEDLKRNLEKVRKQFKKWKDLVDSPEFKKEREAYVRKSSAEREEEKSLQREQRRNRPKVPKPDWAGNELPDPAKHMGGQLLDSETDKYYRSDGKNWVIQN